MRVSDDRYDRDRFRFDLALRMARHGARSRTIREWTGLSEDRLRKLCRTYVLRRSGDAVSRRRIKLPQHVGCFLKSSALEFEASTLGSLFYLLGLLSREHTAAGSMASLDPLQRSEAFCEAYESYLAVHPSGHLSFEHAGFLLNALAHQNGVKLTVCGPCGRLYLTDPARIEFASCGCGPRQLGLPRRRRSAGASAGAGESGS